MNSFILDYNIVLGLITAIILVQLIASSYFTYLYYQNSVLAQSINVMQTFNNCAYNNLPLIKQVCVSDKNTFFFTSSSSDLKYTLSPVPKNYLSVCSTICPDNFDPKLGTCSGINEVSFNKCVEELRPANGCSDLEKPVGYQISTTTRKKVNLYAQKIFNTTC